MSQTLAQFVEKLERLGTGSFIAEVRRKVAVDGLRLIGDGYRRSVDPYGNRWHELKASTVDFKDGRVRVRPKGPRKGGILVKTAAFRDTWMAYPTGTGVRFNSGVDYGAYHQYGTRTIPVRMTIPKSFLGLPRPWSDAINRAYSTTVRQAVA